nr:335_t:CDS:2 [Entrophospora candida]
MLNVMGGSGGGTVDGAILIVLDKVIHKLVTATSFLFRAFFVGPTTFPACLEVWTPLFFIFIDDAAIFLHYYN